MQNLEEIKRRFLRDDLKTRLGGIAVNLARIRSFSTMPENKKVIQDLIEESKFFIEWTVPVASLVVQEELVNLQVQLALCGYTGEKKGITRLAGRWSKKILELSGLLKEA